MDDLADLVVFALPEPADPAVLAVRSPQRRIDMPFGIERYHEFISVPGGARWKLLRSGEV
jgi:hypothetical protein